MPYYGISRHCRRRRRMYLCSCCPATRRHSKHNPAAMLTRRRSRRQSRCPRRVTNRKLHPGALFLSVPGFPAPCSCQCTKPPAS